MKFLLVPIIVLALSAPGLAHARPQPQIQVNPGLYTALVDYYQQQDFAFGPYFLLGEGLKDAR